MDKFKTTYNDPRKWYLCNEESQNNYYDSGVQYRGKNSITPITGLLVVSENCLLSLFKVP